MMSVAITILFLAILEGLLSFDNALALAAMVKHLPQAQQNKALKYGIIGAFAFRALALTVITFLMTSVWVKLVGGGYLLFIALKYFVAKEQNEVKIVEAAASVFWKTVLMVELTDIAFSVDSILASVALSQKVWVVFVGGVLGIIMMRFAAQYFLVLMEKFPRLETTAYLLVSIVGVKLVLLGLGSYQLVPLLDFEDGYAALGFWSLMILAMVYGFKKEKVNGSNNNQVAG